MLRSCVSIRDKLLQKKYDEHKVRSSNPHNFISSLSGIFHFTLLEMCLHLQADFSENIQRDLLDALLRAKYSSENNNTSTQDVGLTDDHLLMTVGDIFGAGVETTTTVLKWTVLYLLHNPQVTNWLFSYHVLLVTKIQTIWNIKVYFIIYINILYQLYILLI